MPKIVLRPYLAVVDWTKPAPDWAPYHVPSLKTRAEVEERLLEWMADTSGSWVRDHAVPETFRFERRTDRDKFAAEWE